MKEKFEIVRDLLKRKSVQDIQVFLSFTNIYKKFIKNCNKIVMLLTFILQIINKTITNEL